MGFATDVVEYRNKINSELKDLFEKKIKEETDEVLKQDYEILKKFVLDGGKRLRPITMILAYKGLGGKKQIIKESLAVELFHNATLIEDDVMDEDEYRRNKPTVYKILKDDYLKNNREKFYRGSLFNRESARTAVSKAILLTNILYAFGGECLLNSSFEKNKINEAMKIYNNAFIKVNQGQIQDIELEKSDGSEKEYIEMAKNKSSYLVRSAMEIGAVFAGAEKKRKDALTNYATNITLAFQLQDDLMDVNPESKKGREIGSDIKQGKRTLLVIKTFELGNKKEKRILKRVLGNSNAYNREIKKAIETMHSSGAHEYCHKLALKKVIKGKIHLKEAKLKKDSHEFFMNFADYVVKRNI
ncbi:MAG: polyprenyl synthetase family protein [archaeon]